MVQIACVITGSNCKLYFSASLSREYKNKFTANLNFKRGRGQKIIYNLN